MQADAVPHAALHGARRGGAESSMVGQTARRESSSSIHFRSTLFDEHRNPGADKNNLQELSRTKCRVKRTPGHVMRVNRATWLNLCITQSLSDNYCTEIFEEENIQDASQAATNTHAAHCCGA